MRQKLDLNVTLLQEQYLWMRRSWKLQFYWCWSSGVTKDNIGDKVTVGAGSLVNSDIPPNSVVVEIPQK